jgi:hypothetical protein
MKLRNLITVTAVLAAVFGLGFLVLPGALWSVYGVRLDGSGELQARLLGVANLGIGLMLWFSRQAGPAAERGLGLGVLCWVVIEGVLLAAAVLMGIVGPLGWGLVAFDAVLAIAYAYFLFLAGERAGEPAGGLVG